MSVREDILYLEWSLVLTQLGYELAQFEIRYPFVTVLFFNKIALNNRKYSQIVYQYLPPSIKKVHFARKITVFILFTGFSNKIIFMVSNAFPQRNML